MKRVLYIGEEVIQIKGGADQVNKRNINLLLDSGNLLKILSSSNKKGKIKKYLFGVDRSFIKRVLEELSLNQYHIVFISQSLQGRIAEHIKNKYPEIIVICFFHNIEKQYASELVRVAGLFHLPFYWAAWYSEQKAVCYSDFLITLNSRDANELYRLYGRCADLILPTSFMDKYVEPDICLKKSNEIIYLFVGVTFFANIEGITWFVSKVFPKIPGKLVIIGKGMDQLAERFSDSRIELHGFVEDLSYYYLIATFIISPIFSGVGMKTKTAEALMYGKAIIGTKEAFEGYERCEVMYECNDSQEFIQTINDLIASHNYSLFNQKSRRLFLSKYSYQSSLQIFSKWIKKKII